MGTRTKAAIQSGLLLFGSLLVALVFCELMTRAYFELTFNRTSRSQLSVSDARIMKKYFDAHTLSDARYLEQPLADRYLGAVNVAKGIDRAWFNEASSVPDRRRSDVNPAAESLQAEYERRGHFGFQANYIWNKQFVQKETCDENPIFTNLPAPVKVFDPPDGRLYPRYRFPASQMLPDGLKTNRYGFRGRGFSPQRKSNAIRIAFIGSSETIGNHSFPFSYPEYFGIWLNRWLVANGYPFHAEIINAGREGIDTRDVEAILREEVLPLAPDYVIFYDGANQLLSAQSFAISSHPIQRFSLEELTHSSGPLPIVLTAHLRIAALLNTAIQEDVAPILDKWRRPKYVFKFPPGIDESRPDLGNPNLPLGLTLYLSNLKRMVDDTRARGIPFTMSTTTWLDGSEPMGENPYRRQIQNMLKAQFWPLKSNEIRRLIDFSATALRQFAASNDVGLFDIAREYPHDAALFTDGYHMTPEGLKLLAWIDLQKFLPKLSQDLERGKLGKLPMVSVHLPLPNGESYAPHCRPVPQLLATATSVPLASMKVGAQGAVLQVRGDRVAFRSAPQAWSYIGEMPLHLGCMSGGGWIAVDIKVDHGTASAGVLYRGSQNFIVEHPVKTGRDSQTIFLRLNSFADAGDLIIRNWSDDSASGGVIRAIRITSQDGKPIQYCVQHSTAE